MTAIYQDEGLPALLKARNGSAGGGPPSHVRLFTSVLHGVGKNSVLADFTQASGMSYAPIALAGGDWSYVLDPPNHVVNGSALVQWNFTAGAGLTLVGYYVVNAALGVSLFAEQFVTPFIIPAFGGFLKLPLTDQYRNCI